MRDEAEHLQTHVVAIDGVDVQTIEKRRGWFDARFLVAERTNAPIGECRRRRFSEVVAHRAEHGAVKVPQCPRQQPRRSDRVRCRRNRPRNEVFDVDRHDLNVSFSDCHLLDAV